MDRRAVAAVFLGVLAVTAGCGLGGGGVTFTSEDVRVGDARGDHTGEYEQIRAAEDRRKRTFSAGGRSATVTVLNHVREYARNASVAGLDTGEPVARFTVLTTPKVEVLGRTFNPVADMTTREIAIGSRPGTTASRTSGSARTER